MGATSSGRNFALRFSLLILVVCAIDLKEISKSQYNSNDQDEMNLGDAKLDPSSE
jgi:hypothetical protein